jgi:hypothetical protein
MITLMRFHSLRIEFLLSETNNAYSMPHTTTKNYRPKRGDTRPNSKKRKQEFKKKDATIKISDIRVTKIQNSEKKERIVISASTERKELSKDEKLIRALRKKLNGILELKEKKEKGQILNLAQEEKLASMDTVLVDLKALIPKTV